MARKKSKKNKKLNHILWGLLVFLMVAIIGGTAYLMIFSKPKAIDIKGKYKGDNTFLSFVTFFDKYTVFGIDVSEYQASIDWKKVASEKCMSFVFIRATAGNNRTDKNYITNWYAAGQQNLVRGAYHYYRPNENSTGQAQKFIETVSLTTGDFPPVLDIEKYSHIQSTSSLKAGLLNWLEIVETHYGIAPILYTSPNIYQNMFASDKRFNKYPVWISSFNLSRNPSDVAAKWKFWQFSDKAIVKGIKGSVDVNLFNGSYEELMALTIPLKQPE